MNRLLPILQSKLFWLAAFATWGLTLFTISSFSHPLPQDVTGYPHIDKVLHFGYFFGGGIIATIWLSLANTQSPNTVSRFLLPILLLAIIGLLDEYRQSFTPGRSGNDFYDWLADVSGAAAGTVLVKLLRNPLRTLLQLKGPSQNFKIQPTTEKP